MHDLASATSNVVLASTTRVFLKYSKCTVFWGRPYLAAIWWPALTWTGTADIACMCGLLSPERSPRMRSCAAGGESEMGLHPVTQKCEPFRKRELLTIFREVVKLVAEPSMLQRLRHGEEAA